MNNPDMNWKIPVILMVFTSNRNGIDPGLTVFWHVTPYEKPARVLFMMNNTDFCITRGINYVLHEN
jgi:hypothetical protein